MNTTHDIYYGTIFGVNYDCIIDKEHILSSETIRVEDIPESYRTFWDEEDHVLKVTIITSGILKAVELLVSQLKDTTNTDIYDGDENENDVLPNTLLQLHQCLLILVSENILTEDKANEYWSITYDAYRKVTGLTIVGLHDLGLHDYKPIPEIISLQELKEKVTQYPFHILSIHGEAYGTHSKAIYPIEFDGTDTEDDFPYDSGYLYTYKDRVGLIKDLDAFVDELDLSEGNDDQYYDYNPDILDMILYGANLLPTYLSDHYIGNVKEKIQDFLKESEDQEMMGIYAAYLEKEDILEEAKGYRAYIS